MGKAITKAKEIAAETKNTTAASAAGIATDKAGKALAEAGAAMAAPAAQEEPQAPAVTLDELEGMDDALWTQDEAEDAPPPRMEDHRRRLRRLGLPQNRRGKGRA